MRVLMVLSSTPDPPQTAIARTTQLKAFAAAYYLFTDAGAEVTLASPDGGGTPFAWPPASADIDPVIARFHGDREARDQLSDTLALERVYPEDFDLAFYPGECPSHPSAMWDLARHPASQALIGALWSRRPMAFVGTASAAMLWMNDEAGVPLLSGRRITGVTASEQRAVAPEPDGPTLEDRLEACGAIYSRTADWTSYVVTDGLLVTGQNATSAAPAADRALALALGRTST